MQEMRREVGVKRHILTQLSVVLIFHLFYFMLCYVTLVHKILIIQNLFDSKYIQAGKIHSFLTGFHK